MIFNLTSGTITVPYSQSITFPTPTNSGTSWTLSNISELPAGFTITSYNSFNVYTVAGTPENTGNNSFTFNATDGVQTIVCTVNFVVYAYIAPTIMFPPQRYSLNVTIDKEVTVPDYAEISNKMTWPQYIILPPHADFEAYINANWSGLSAYYTDAFVKIRFGIYELAQFLKANNIPAITAATNQTLIDYYINNVVKSGQLLMIPLIGLLTHLDNFMKQYEFAFQYNCKWINILSTGLEAGMNPSTMIQKAETVSTGGETSSEMNYQLGFSATVGTGDMSPVKVEATISAQFGQSFTHSTNFSNEQTISVGFPDFVANQQCIVDVWQRIGMYNLVYRKTVAAGAKENEWAIFFVGTEDLTTTTNFTLATVFPNNASEAS